MTTLRDMQIRAVTFFALFVCGAAMADVTERFAKVRDDAEAIEGLGSFLDRYIGDCGILPSPDCISRAKTFRQGATGKKFYMIVTEESASMLSMGAFDPSTQKFTINMTPIFPASSYALTHGIPSRTDAHGNPVMTYLPISGVAPEETDAATIGRWVSMRNVRVQVVFTPQGVWEMPKKGGGKIRGVKAQFVAVRLTNAKNGAELGLWFAR